MPPLPQDRAARIAEQALQHPLAQRFSFAATSALIDISRGSTGIPPDDADRLALVAVVTAEVMAAREAGR
jgi:hypothetical protein